MNEQDFIEAHRIAYRTVYRRSMGFDVWLKAKEIDPAIIATKRERTLAMGSLLFQQQNTRASEGKQNGLLKKVDEANRLFRQYEEEVPALPVQKPIDLDDVADRAYIRVLMKRHNRNNIEEF